MVRHPAVEPETAEPAVGEVEVDLVAQPALGADAEAGADEQHADHQLGGDRRPTGRSVERRQLPAQAAEVDEAVDGAQQMIGRNVGFQRNLVEQAVLLDLPRTHHLR